MHNINLGFNVMILEMFDQVHVYTIHSHQISSYDNFFVNIHVHLCIIMLIPECVYVATYMYVHQ